MLPLFCTLLYAETDPATCVGIDGEEYSALAAVLFPNTPDIPEGMTNELEQKAYIASKRIRLDGFHGNSYVIQETSIVWKISSQLDPEILADLNRKNSQSCNFEEDRLRAYIPAGKIVKFVSSDKIRQRRSGASPKSDGREILGEGHLLESEITRLARPGFDLSRTTAVVEIDLRADSEMGVGYRTYLKKSPKTGQWLLIKAEQTRIY